jgi:hypothetical protein
MPQSSSMNHGATQCMRAIRAGLQQRQHQRTKEEQQEQLQPHQEQQLQK